MNVLTGKETFESEKWLQISQDYMKKFYEETKAVLLDNEGLLRDIANRLLAKETLNEKEIASFFA